MAVAAHASHTPTFPTATLAEVKAALATGPTILFMGAGPSVALGGPNWETLEKRIREKFVEPEHHEEMAHRGWWDVMDHVCDSMDRRSAVEEYIAEILREANPEPWMDDLLQAPWDEIYTTNYDDIPDRLNNVSSAGKVRFVSYAGGNLPEIVLPRERPVIKLMGDANYRHPSKAAMILSQSDRTFHPPSEAYRQAIQRLRERIDDGVNVVVVGQSLEDRVLLTVLQDVARLHGAKPEGKMFVLARKQLKWDIAKALSKLQIAVVSASAQDLAKELNGAKGYVPPERNRTIRVHGKKVVLGAHILRTLDACGILIDATYEGSKLDGPEEFLSRSSYCKDAFAKHWDFKRTLHRLNHDGRSTAGTGTVKDVVAGLLDNPSISRSIALMGPPGSAKTLTALRIAHDWVEAGRLALVVDARQGTLDGAVIADCVHGLQQEIIAQLGVGPDPAGASILVILDNGGSDSRLVDRLRTTLRARSIATGRLLLTGKPPQLSHFLPILSSAWELSAKMTGTELTRLTEYALKLPHPPTGMEIDGVRLRAETLGYWGALYQLVEPSRKPLEESILIHCESMDQWGKDVAYLAACFETINVPLPLTVLSRMVSGKSRSEIRREIETGMIGQVVSLVRTDDFECLQFLNKPSAHRLAVEWKIRRNPHHLIQSFIGSIGDDSRESSQCCRWLVRGLAQREDEDLVGRHLVLSTGEREHLLGELSNRFPVPMVLHHHGRLLRQTRRYAQAIQRLETALRHPGVGTERANIYHSLAVTSVRYAQELNDATDSMAASDLIDRAEDALSRASTDRPTYRYSTSAEILLEKARLPVSSDQKRELLCKAYTESKYAELFARTDASEEVARNLLGKVIEKLGEIAITEADARKLAVDHKSAAGYHKLVFELLQGPPWCDKDSSSLKAAKALLEAGHKLVPRDGLLLHSLVRVTLALDPADATLDGKLDSLASLGMKDEALLLRAYLAACRTQTKIMRDCLDELQRSFPGFHVQATRRKELVLRNTSGFRYFEVRPGTTPWIQFGDGRLNVAGAETGDKVGIEIMATGALPRMLE